MPIRNGWPARFDPDHIDAQRRQLILYLPRGPLAYGNRADHRCNSDHDAEHGQRGAQLISFQRAQRHAQRVPINSPVDLGCHRNIASRAAFYPGLRKIAEGGDLVRLW